MTPIRPVSEDHRHEPADYEVEPNELEPCPFCGATPDASHDETFRYTDGFKWGAVVCCGSGPEVRTRYGEIADWKADAIAAWNQRASLATRPANVERGDLARALFAADRMDMVERHPDDSFMQWDDPAFEPVKSLWLMKADHTLTALTQAPRSCCAEERERTDTEAMRQIAADLIDQRDEPDMFSLSYDRVHYWRDKAINAADRIDALAKGGG